MDQNIRDKYEVVIGLEVHAQMLTKTKDNYVLEHADASLKSDKDLQSQAQKNLG